MTREELLRDLDAATRAGDMELASAIDKKLSAPEAKPQAEPTTTQKLWASMPGRLAQGGMDVIDAGAQMLSRLGGPSEAARVDAMVKERGQLYDQAKQATGFQGMDIARPAGSALLQMLALRGIPTAATLTGKIASGAAQGAGFGALQPVTEGSFGTEKAKQMGVGAVTGAVAAPIAEAAARVIKPSGNAAAEALKNQGVQLTPGQMLGGGFKTAEEKMQSLPIVGTIIQNAKDRGIRDLNSAALNRALAPIGEKLPKGAAGRDAVEFTADKLGNAYDDVLGKIGQVVPDKQLISDLNEIAAAVANSPKDKMEQFIRILRNEVADRAKGGVLTGEQLKAAESQLGSIARGYRSSGDYDQRVLGEAVQQAQAALRQMVQRQAPQEADRLAAINKGWANFLIPQKAASSVAAEEGVFTPAQLHSAVKAVDPSRNKAAFSRGKALMQDLSEPAKSLMQDSVRNSGTADRMMASGLVGSLMTHPIATMKGAAAALPVAAMYSPLGLRATTGLLTSRPQVADPIAEIVRRNSLPISSALYPAAYGLLNGGK